MSDERICANCNAVVPEGHHFCGKCGARYAGDQEAEADEQTLYYGAMQAPGRAKLVLIRGEGLEGLSYHLNATEHIAGREEGAVLFPDDDYLDPSHARFFYRDNQLFLTDEDSTNETFLQIREPTELQDGAEIYIGEQRLRIEFLSLQGEYPMSGNTLMYVCPPKDYKFRLVHVLEGGRDGSAYCSVNNDILIGRQGCDINFPDDPHVSPQHARLTWTDGTVTVTDQDSKNGTFVSLSGEEQLQHGDYVMFGSELVRVEINE
ncbi:MAG: FHA domain-containing protein [Bradymonadaceae bacterium]